MLIGEITLYLSKYSITIMLVIVLVNSPGAIINKTIMEFIKNDYVELLIFPFMVPTMGSRFVIQIRLMKLQ